MSGNGPLDQLQAIARQEVQLAPGLTHLEVFTMRGLLSVLWHGAHDASSVVVAAGGAMGGLLGPADGLYHDLGESFAEQGIGMMRVGWRRPNDLDLCRLDLLAACDLAARAGAERFVTVGHSFGGAVAIQAAVAMGAWAAGVVTLATQSAGCEAASELGDVPLILFHGDRDELLAPAASEMVRMLAGTGELVVLPGAGHLLTEAGSVLRERLESWIPEQFERHSRGEARTPEASPL
ncbi:MAG: alpha/beta hydrolase [Actinomycetota bacterium]|nr:alpha/beta hydrolase [Actinomycetota bacterium]